MEILASIPFHHSQAVVFDIDDTLIDSDTDRVMPRTLSLYRHCVSRGYMVYIVTARARTPEGIAYTLDQLRHAGITGFRAIAFRPPHDMDVYAYKRNARRAIPGHVVMSVGDQPWDIGQYGGFGVIVRK